MSNNENEINKAIGNKKMVKFYLSDQISAVETTDEPIKLNDFQEAYRQLLFIDNKIVHRGNLHQLAYAIVRKQEGRQSQVNKLTLDSRHEANEMACSHSLRGPSLIIEYNAPLETEDDIIEVHPVLDNLLVTVRYDDDSFTYNLDRIKNEEPLSSFEEIKAYMEWLDIQSKCDLDNYDNIKNKILVMSEYRENLRPQILDLMQKANEELSYQQPQNLNNFFANPNLPAQTTPKCIENLQAYHEENYFSYLKSALPSE